MTEENARLVPKSSKRHKHVDGEYAKLTSGQNSSSDSESTSIQDHSRKRRKRQAPKKTAPAQTQTTKSATQTTLPFARQNKDNNVRQSTSNAKDDDDDVDDKVVTKEKTSTTTTTISVTKSGTTNVNDPNRVYGANVTDRERADAPPKQGRGRDRDADARSKMSWANVAFDEEAFGDRQRWRCLIGDCDKPLMADGSSTSARRKHVELLHKKVFEQLERAQTKGKGESKFREIVASVPKLRQGKVYEKKEVTPEVKPFY